MSLVWWSGSRVDIEIDPNCKVLPKNLMRKLRFSLLLEEEGSCLLVPALACLSK